MKPGKHQKRVLGQMLGVVGGFVFAGLFLLLHVWFPIQAQRSLRELKDCQKQISEEKALLDQLNETYNHLTSLSALDEWAKKNGPWRNPQKDDVVLMYE